MGIVTAKITKMLRYILDKLWVFQKIVIPLRQKLFSISEKFPCSILRLICTLFQIVPVNRNQINPGRNNNIEGSQQRCNKPQAKACPTQALQRAVQGFRSAIIHVDWIIMLLATLRRQGSHYFWSEIPSHGWETLINESLTNNDAYLNVLVFLKYSNQKLYYRIPKKL